MFLSRFLVKPISAIEEIMKKILSIALVALLAASAVFAGITGKASFAAGYDLDDNLFSLSNSK